MSERQASAHCPASVLFIRIKDESASPASWSPAKSRPGPAARETNEDLCTATVCEPPKDALFVSKCLRQRALPPRMAIRKAALITGGARGIGFQVAQAFARAGYDLTILARTQKNLDAAVRTALPSTAGPPATLLVFPAGSCLPT